MKGLFRSSLCLLVATATASVIPKRTSPSLPTLKVDRVDGVLTHKQPSAVRRGLLSCFGGSAVKGDNCVPLQGAYNGVGLYLDNLSLDSTQVTAIESAIVGVQAMAAASILAVGPKLVTAVNNPFHLFFGYPPIPQVKQYFSSIARYLDEKEYTFNWPIHITMQDDEKVCSSAEQPLSYGSISGKTRIIHLCPSFFLLPPPGKVCENVLARNGFDGIGGLSSSTVLLHELLHAIPEAVSDGIRNVPDGIGTKNCLDLALHPYSGTPSLDWADAANAVFNVDSYVWAANFARDVGFQTLLGPEASARICVDDLEELAQTSSLMQTGEYSSQDNLVKYHDGKLESSETLAEQVGSPKLADPTAGPWGPLGISQAEYLFDDGWP